MTATVEIVPDDQWLERVGATSKEGLVLTPTRRAVITALAEHGPFTDRGGRATVQLARAVGYTGTQAALSGVLRHHVMSHAIDRDLKGKRTFRIALKAVPERWAHLLTNGDDTAKPEATVTPIEVPDVLPEPEPDVTENMRLEIAGSVADALLARVVEIVRSPDADKQAVLERDKALTELAEVQDRLATALNYGTTQRNAVQRLGEDLIAVKQERDGLRIRLRQAEANVERLTRPGGQAAIVNELVQVELAKVMRATPQPHARGPDDAG